MFKFLQQTSTYIFKWWKLNFVKTKLRHIFIAVFQLLPAVTQFPQSYVEQATRLTVISTLLVADSKRRPAHYVLIHSTMKLDCRDTLSFQLVVSQWRNSTRRSTYSTDTSLYLTQNTVAIKSPKTSIIQLKIIMLLNKLHKRAAMNSVCPVKRHKTELPIDFFATVLLRQCCTKMMQSLVWSGHSRHIAWKEK